MIAAALHNAAPPSTDDALHTLDDPLEQGRYTRRVLGPQGQTLAETTLQLSGLRCAACAGIIEAALLRMRGVQQAQVSAAAERATVCWDPASLALSALIQAVRGVGYGAVPDAAAPARALRRQAQRQALWRWFVAGFCAMQVMMLATPSYVAAPGELSAEMRQLLNWASWVLTLPVMAFSAAPFFSGAWAALRQRRMGMDVPVVLGLLVTFVASSGATFDPGGVFGTEVYFDSLTMFLSFLLGARWLEQQTRDRAAQSLERELARLPPSAFRVEPDGELVEVSVLRLRVGDVVQVPLGQAFPADGLITQGQTQADEALLSGESAPVPKAVGSAVVAGSVNLGAPVRMHVQRLGGDTRLEGIVSMMKSAAAQRPAAARLADRWAAPFLWVVLLLAAAAALVWSQIDPSRAVWVVVSVLIVTCPCALSLAVPATLLAAARGLARRGVVLQRLDALEPLARARHFFFDKTGTLTQERPQWQATRLSAAAQAQGFDVATLLVTAASLARWSSHPVAQALALQPQAQQAWSAVAEHPGQGVSATDAQQRNWRLGRAAWVGGLAGDTGTALGCDGLLLAHFELTEAPRPDAQAALQALRGDGVILHLASGDGTARTQALADTLGIRHVLAAATPEAKLAAVAQLQAQGEQVVMVGDGINDAPVLARADASLAMGQGAWVARGQADAVISANHLLALVQARTSAQRALAIVRQNLVWAAAYNLLAIPLALLGWLPPWAAGLGMAGSSLLVVANAQRAAR